MKYISFYRQQVKYKGELTREQIDELIEWDFLQMMERYKSWPPENVLTILIEYLKSFPENKSQWVLKTMALLEKHRDRWPPSHYQDWQSYFMALINENNLPGLRLIEGTAAEVVRQKLDYINHELDQGRKLNNICEDLSYWYGHKTNSIKQALKRIPGQYRKSKRTRESIIREMLSALEEIRGNLENDRINEPEYDTIRAILLKTLSKIRAKKNS